MSPSASASILRYVDLAARILELPPSCGPVRLVAIDGPGGAGKSTFSRRLATALGSVQAIHTDDFASWEVPIEWFPRLLAQVIEPFSAGRPGRYQRYDWVRRELVEWHDVRPDPVVLLEGVGSARRTVAGQLAFAVWIETPAELRLARGIERDGEGLRDFWHEWIAAEDAHYAADLTRERASVLVDGSPAVPHDREAEFVIAATTQAQAIGSQSRTNG